MYDPAEGLIQLSAYLDGELDEAEAGRVVALLLTDSGLAEEYRLLKQVCAALGCWDRYDSVDVCASPTFEDKLAKRLLRFRHSGNTFPSPGSSLATVSRN